MTTLKRKNTRGLEVEAVIREQGPISRLELQQHFEVRQSTMQDHIMSLRKKKRVYVHSWSSPEGPGNWSPLYAVRVTGEERDMVQPPSVRLALGLTGSVLEEDEFPQKVVRSSEGVRTDHALLARSLFAEAGMWGSLLLDLQPDSDRAPHRRTAAATTSAVR